MSYLAQPCKGRKIMLDSMMHCAVLYGDGKETLTAFYPQQRGCTFYTPICLFSDGQFMT